MKKITTALLGSALTVALSSTSAAAADLDALAGLDDAIVASLQNAVMSATQWGIKCMSIDNKDGMAWNGGELCVKNREFNSNRPVSPADAQLASDALGGSGEDMTGSVCVSAGGSSASSGNGGGLCVAADAMFPRARFAFANGFPLIAMQFLQVVFRDGTSFSSSRAAAKCLSAGGAVGHNGRPGGSCLASDLDTGIEGSARLAFANDTPMAQLQFLQITFRNGSPLPGAPAGTGCLSDGGSSASSGTAGGFCFAADLNTTNTLGSAHFAIANRLSAVGMQFLQVTYGAAGPGGIGGGAACAAEAGSFASIGNPGGACEASDYSSSDGTANFTMANELPAGGLQFFQATFGQPGSGFDAPGQSCVSSDGSVARTGNSDGFCLVADRGRRNRGLASFAVANDSGVSNMEYVQIPFGQGTPRRNRTYPNDREPIGVSLSDCAVGSLDHPSLPAVALNAGTDRLRRTYSNQISGLREYTSRDRGRYRQLRFALGSRSGLTRSERRACRERPSVLGWGEMIWRY